ncbi:hypothetical protein IE53DRAFT_362670 [Violaceomyces palustris]|uniref:Uncharacterized protein n=1 Tax=Violaceomyces palustris TaxID=1673888 RepID=A0ACD0NWA0_9BASI|nr:hypothetical protein IE53DRAFT_362670 [Violaceomyces palustris]
MRKHHDLKSQHPERTRVKVNRSNSFADYGTFPEGEIVNDVFEGEVCLDPEMWSIFRNQNRSYGFQPDPLIQLLDIESQSIYFQRKTLLCAYEEGPGNSTSLQVLHRDIAKRRIGILFASVKEETTDVIVHGVARQLKKGFRRKFLTFPASLLAWVTREVLERSTRPCMQWNHICKVLGDFKPPHREACLSRMISSVSKFDPWLDSSQIISPRQPEQQSFVIWVSQTRIGKRHKKLRMNGVPPGVGTDKRDSELPGRGASDEMVEDDVKLIPIRVERRRKLLNLTILISITNLCLHSVFPKIFLRRLLSLFTLGDIERNFCLVKEEMDLLSDYHRFYLQPRSKLLSTRFRDFSPEAEVEATLKALHAAESLERIRMDERIVTLNRSAFAAIRSPQRIDADEALPRREEVIAREMGKPLSFHKPMTTGHGMWEEEDEEDPQMQLAFRDDPLHPPRKWKDSKPSRFNRVLRRFPSIQETLSFNHQPSSIEMGLEKPSLNSQDSGMDNLIVTPGLTLLSGSTSCQQGLTDLESETREAQTTQPHPHPIFVRTKSQQSGGDGVGRKRRRFSFRSSLSSRSSGKEKFTDQVERARSGSIQEMRTRERPNEVDLSESARECRVLLDGPLRDGIPQVNQGSRSRGGGRASLPRASVIKVVNDLTR